MTVARAFSPAGLKVLLVDDDRVCLTILGKQLRQCKYSVTTCDSAAAALSLVKDDNNPFDLVLCDVHMPGMDGFKLLEAIGLERDLPVIMMSSDGETEVVMKGIKQGACDYIIKPVGLASLQNIWQHVFRKLGAKEAAKDNDSNSTETGRGPKFQTEGENCRKRKGKQEATDEVEYADGLKKSRLIWTEELHKKFVDAVETLGRDKAVPKKILEKMNVKGVTREHVASHLQKYRKFLTGSDVEDLLSGVNKQHNPTDSFQVGGSFGGLVDIQPGSVNTPLFPLNSVVSNWNPGYRAETDLYPVPSQAFQSVQVGNVACSGNTELYPEPPFDVASSSNVELYPGVPFVEVPAPRNVELYPFPSLDVTSGSNILTRLRQCNVLGDIFPSNLVPPSDLDVTYLPTNLSEGKRRGM